MNFKQRVQKVVPHAKCERWVSSSSGLTYYTVRDDKRDKPNLGTASTAREAWVSAYFCLESLGEINK